MFHNCQSLTSVNFGNSGTNSLMVMVGMFYDCFSLEQIDLSSFDTSNVFNMSLLFHRCYNIKSIKFGNFKTSNVECMSYMFFRCNKLNNLNLNSFDTSKVKDMKYMFCNCHEIVSLDLSKFITSSVTDMSAMFAANFKLISLDLTNFDTSKVTSMRNLFESCYILNSLKISSFDTSQVANMNLMFYDCLSLTYLYLSNFRTPRLLSMAKMFHNCQKLPSLDISSFDTSKVQRMDYIFNQCYSLTSLKLNNFNTQSVLTMEGMFADCISLSSLDISKFKTNLVQYLNFMFYNCRSLSVLNLSNFYTPNLRRIDSMFFNCSSLENLDISNFDIRNTIDMESTFYNCRKLKSLDLSNFYTQNVVYMNNTFENCLSLTTIDLSKWDTSSVKYINHMFNGCKSLEYINFMKYDENQIMEIINDILTYTPENIVICINQDKKVNNLMKVINAKLCPTIYCGDDWKIHQKIIMPDNTCQDNNLKEVESTFIINTQRTTDTYKEILNNITETLMTSKISDLILNNSLTSELFLRTTHFITSDIKNIYDIETTNAIEMVSSEKIDIKEIQSTNILINNITKDIFSEFPTYTVPSSLLKEKEITTNENINTTNLEISTDLEPSTNIMGDKIVNNKIIISSLMEISTYLKISTNTEIKTEYFDNSNYTSEEINKKIHEQIINNLMNDFEDSNVTEIIKEGKGNFYYQLTSLENELNSKGKNNSIRFSRIDLGKCEDVLREKNNLNENVTFLILKYEKMSNISSERNLQFEIYESVNKTRLNLSVCQDIPIDIYVPLTLSENLQNLYNELKDLGYDLFNNNSGFYQDICTPYKSTNGTDVLLSDRVNYYFNNDETQCQPNCQFSDYSVETQDLKCECNIVSSEIDVEKKPEIGSKSIYKSFYDVLKFSNYKVLKCYKLAFNLNIFQNNKGNFIAIVYFVIYLTFLIIYFIKGKAELKEELSKILIDNKSKELNISPVNININPKIEKPKIINIEQKNKNNSNDIIKSGNINGINRDNKTQILRKHSKRRPKPRIIFDFPPKKNLQNINIKIINKPSNIEKYKDINSKNKIYENSREVIETKNN